MAAATPLTEVPEQHRSKVHEWMKAAKAAADATALEKKLRQELFDSVFTDPKEGTNKAALPAGWVLEGDLKFNRTLDDAALPAALEELRRLPLKDMLVSVDAMFKYKPSIVVSELRKIEKQAEAERLREAAFYNAHPEGKFEEPTPGMDAMNAISLVMTTKPGLPSIKVIAPKAD